MSEIGSAAIARVQTRTVWTLVAGQILGGLGIGATVSFGALLAAHVSGNDALSGTAATLTTLGAAAAAIPLARLAQARGRRIALSVGIVISALGAGVIVLAAGLTAFALLLLGFALLGVGTAVNLQSRFAATDLAVPNTRGRQLSLVVWSTTIGAVIGPNLSGPGEYMAKLLGMPHLTGSFSFAIAAQLLAAAVFLVALRPDPYLLSQKVAAGLASGAAPASEAAKSDATAPASTPGTTAATEVETATPGTTAATAVQPATPGATAKRVQTATEVETAVARDSAVVAAAASTRRLTIFAIGAIASAQAVMVAVMAMTPVHLVHHGASGGEVGFTISLHIAGMFALSPVFGWLSDQLGRFPTILIGQALLAIGLSTVALGAGSASAVTVGLTFIGLGWSATTVSGSALIAGLATDASRTRLQGRSDLVMNIAGAAGGALAGPVLALVGYAGLALAAGVIVVAVAAATVVVSARTPRTANELSSTTRSKKSATAR
ncbi:MFS transporter [Glaciihabitans tibetensis]|uniref:MFS transporter n=1 Tax=Glaciihabitans tibetensis TaxID=1266600 RepID=A0A2T0VBK1_9MICO|nr:MFS transporter [Glaciihabitans tibetensis]PRY67448.1 MFS transporter [Glaciihabitans tibetensis]